MEWWHNFLPEFDGTAMLWLQDLLPINALMASDASLTGGGGTHQREMFHVKFPESLLNVARTIAQLETFTIFIAIKLWAKQLSGQVVRFHTDNENAMFAINKGRSHDKFILQCIREIAWYTAKYEIFA